MGLFLEAEQFIRRKLEGLSLDEILGAVLNQYAYQPDETKPPVQEGDQWFRHGTGHALFIYPDFLTGFGWHLYRAGKDNVVFQKGLGVKTLADALASLHTEGTES